MLFKSMQMEEKVSQLPYKSVRAKGKCGKELERSERRA